MPSVESRDVQTRLAGRMAVVAIAPANTASATACFHRYAG